MSCNYELSIRKVASVLSGLNLSGIGSNVVVQDIGDEEKDLATLPGVIVFPFGDEKENEGPDVPTNKVDVGYPVVVWIVDTKAATKAATRDSRYTWRRAMKDALRHKKWDNGTDYVGQFDTRIEPGPVIDGGLWFTGQLFGSMFTVRVWWRENIA